MYNRKQTQQSQALVTKASNWDSWITEQRVQYIEDITWWREDMNFMFEWQEQYLMNERSERVRYCFGP